MANTRRVSLTVNGETYEAEAEPRLSLVDFLRGTLALTGTHVGCEHGVCGACTVLVDGRAVRSCLMLAVQADGHVLQTVEGLVTDGKLHPIQEAFVEEHGLQPWAARSVAAQATSRSFVRYVRPRASSGAGRSPAPLRPPRSLRPRSSHVRRNPQIPRRPSQ